MDNLRSVNLYLFERFTDLVVCSDALGCERRRYFLAVDRFLALHIKRAEVRLHQQFPASVMGSELLERRDELHLQHRPGTPKTSAWILPAC